MNLDLSLIGWIHTAFSIAALVTGGFVFLDRKGTSRHRSVGKVYVLVLSLVNFTALGIYRQGTFWFPHWFAVAALVTIAVGFSCAHFKRPETFWLPGHLTSMVVSYWLLIGGSVNEVFLRVAALRAIAPNVQASPIVGMTHFTVMVFFAILAAYFNIRYWRNNGRRASV
jgi:Predicted membrane protein (DUF2306)